MLLPIAEFCINSSPSVALGGSSPFQVSYGFNPSSPTSLSFALSEEGREADDLTETLDRYSKAAKAALNQAHEKARTYHNLRHKHVELEVGNAVFIDYQAIPVGDVHNQKLLSSFRTKFVGPFEVVAKRSAVNYELALPSSFKRSPVFHISQLRLKKDLPAGFFRAPSAPSAGFRSYKDGTVDMEIKAICDHKKKAKGYVVQVLFVDGSKEWKRLSEVRKSAGELVTGYAVKNSLSW
ncbi:unnamed protein product [Ambrosiozyma monospora]|uniref:Unnamed protein product n=1 Tax=Ambrosiozyma monospora TaxID=43982 RepID=A0A9W6Z898_AMBMO|nr:unnamed protein product [Ambrosiozyma monospora]